VSNKAGPSHEQDEHAAVLSKPSRKSQTVTAAQVVVKISAGVMVNVFISLHLLKFPQIN